MKHFFLEDISADERDRLDRHGIEVTIWSLDDETRGVLIAENVLERAKTLLGIQTFESEETDYDDIYSLRWERLVHDQIPPPSEPIDLSKFTSHLPKGMRDLLHEELGSKLLQQIVITGPHGTAVTPVPGPAFHIHLWAAPQPGTQERPAASLWGIDHGINKWRFGVSDLRGSASQGVIRDFNGSPVAELVNGNNLYVYYNFAQAAPGVFRALMKRVAEQAVILCLPDEVSRKHAEARLFERDLGESFELYLASVMQGVNAQHGELLKKQLALNEQMRTAYQTFLKSSRELQAITLNIEALGGVLREQREKIRHEFTLLMRLPKIRKVESKNGQLHFFTEVLYCPDKRGRIHEIGAFRIELRMKEGEVRWFNLTRRIDAHNTNMSAPHIYEDGSACLGNAQLMFEQLWKGWEIAQIVLLAIQFVESVNEADAAGKHISKWPVVNREERVEKAVA